MPTIGPWAQAFLLALWLPWIGCSLAVSTEGRAGNFVFLPLAAAYPLTLLAGAWLWQRIAQPRLPLSGWGRLFVVAWMVWLPITGLHVADRYEDGYIDSDEAAVLQFVLLAFALPPVALVLGRWVHRGFRTPPPPQHPPSP